MARKKIITVPILLVELEDHNFHILIETTLSKGIKGKWVVDTGASKTVFDVNQSEHFSIVEMGNTEIQSAGLGEGNIDTQIGELHVLTIGDVELLNEPVALIDLSFINEIYNRFTYESIVGLIGSDFLVKHDAVVNFKKKEIKLYF